MAAEGYVSPMKAIRLKCLDCCCGQFNEVSGCTATGCPSYRFRSGKNPNCSGTRKKKTDETIDA